MITPRALIILGLALCTTAGAVIPALATPAWAAPAAPTIAVTTQVSTSYLPGSYGTVALRRLTLHISGSGFIPGSKVRLAVLTTSPWEVLGKGSTHAQDAVITSWCDEQHSVCSRPNSQAGTIDYRMRFSSVPAAPTLLVLYRSASHTGMHDVIL